MLFDYLGLTEPWADCVEVPEEVELAVRKKNGATYLFLLNYMFHEEIITLKKEWTGFYSRIAQKFFHKPRFSKIALDGYGSFIWKSIDGCKDVYALSKELDEAFPDMEKSLPRLIKFLEILRDHQFIMWKDQTH